jgi:hypothetical protein
MNAWFTTADDVLRRAAWTSLPNGSRSGLVRLVGCLIAFGLFYGATMGTFRGLAGESEWLRQIAYSAVKVPLLMLATFLISLPSFFVLNTLFGLRRDFAQALRAVVATQAGMAVVLASFAPLTVLWYVSSANYNRALLFNGAMFAVASISAQWLLRQYYRPLVARNRRHRWILWGWLAVYTLVAIQMAWLLRPFIGAPAIDVSFLRPEAWDNAYIKVLQLIGRTLGW